MNTRLLAVLVVLAAAFLWSCSSSDQPTEPTEQGLSVSGFIVSDEPTDDIDWVVVHLGNRTTTTDAQGRFTFKNVDTGSYVIRPAYDGREYLPARMTIHVDTASIDSLTFVIQPPDEHPLEMIEVAPGSFMMGNDANADLFVTYAVPRHKVTLTKTIMVSKTEVTQGQWMKVMEGNPSPLQHPDHPVSRMSYAEAAVFCNRMSELHGLDHVYTGAGNDIKPDFTKNGYRLITEAEWEYVASAGDTTALYGIDDVGNDYTDQDYERVIKQINAYAWTEDNAGPLGNAESHPVALLQPNAWGFYDMIGNVSELVEDTYYGYTADAQTDPEHTAFQTYRIVRGSNFGQLLLQNHTLRYRTAEKYTPAPFAVGMRIARNK